MPARRRIRTRSVTGVAGTPPPGEAGDRDVTFLDSFALADAMAGTLGPFNAPDSFDIFDKLVAGDLALLDTVAFSDLLRAVEDLRVRDSVDLNDRLAGTLGPIDAPDSFTLSDTLDADDLTMQDSIAMSDAPDGQWAADAQARDSLALSDAPEATTRLQDSVAIADALDDIGRLGVADSLAIGDQWGPARDVAVRDSLDLSDARTADQVTARALDTLDIADKLRTLDLVPREELVIIDLLPQADLNMTLWANAAVTATNWDNSGNAIDTDIATAANAVVASSGIGGITNNSEAGDLVLSYPDPTASLSPFIWDSATLEYRWRTFSSGTQIIAGTVSYTVRYSLNNGGAYTDIETITAPVSDPGQQTTDLTGIADTLTELQQFRFRMDGTITSGTGLGKTQQLDCYYARLIIAGHRTF